MMKKFWDNRYAEKDYAYGVEPNAFLKEALAEISGKGSLLLPAEGEGRNAVYAATIGWEVTCFDTSVKGKEKAERLAAKAAVSIDYHTAGFEDFHPNQSFDVVALIFAHMPKPKRAQWLQKCVSYIRPGGLLLIEGFSKDQLGRDSGGPKDVDMLYSKAEMEAELQGVQIVYMEASEQSLDEGEYHQGEAMLLRVKARRH